MQGITLSPCYLNLWISKIRCIQGCLGWVTSTSTVKDKIGHGLTCLVLYLLPSLGCLARSTILSLVYYSSWLCIRCILVLRIVKTIVFSYVGVNSFVRVGMGGDIV